LTRSRAAGVVLARAPYAAHGRRHAIACARVSLGGRDSA
jgi:hypothetical protein